MGFARFTWGNSTLLAGIEMIPVMIGMFAITEVLIKLLNAPRWKILVIPVKFQQNSLP